MHLLPPTRRRLLWLTAFAVAMAQLEAAVVVYLRQLFYPQGFAFPLVLVTGRTLAVEVGREAATIVMLGTVAAVSSHDRWRRFAAFMLLFGVWDIFYYVWLRVMDGWPVSLFTDDILFLIPLPWVGPVAAPVLISLTLVLAALGVESLRDRGVAVRVTPAEWAATVASGVALLVLFMADAGSVGRGGMPGSFPWPLFLAFLALGGAAAARAYRRAAKDGARRPAG